MTFYQTEHGLFVINKVFKDAEEKIIKGGRTYTEYDPPISGICLLFF